MKSLSYTTMCIKEAMRLYPPVPHYFRDLSEDTIINGSLIPKGHRIFILYLQHQAIVIYLYSTATLTINASWLIKFLYFLVIYNKIVYN